MSRLCRAAMVLAAAAVLAGPCAAGNRVCAQQTEQPPAEAAAGGGEPANGGEQPDEPPPAEPGTQGLPELPETTVVGQPSGVGSQGSAVPGETTVESPTRTDQPLSQVGSSLSVVTSEQIRERQQTSVAEVLRGLPGVDVVRQGQAGGVTSVFLRGASSEQTKVLVDGIPVNDPISPGRGFDFSTLAVDNIERIEVLRGPQSTLYGSDAIGGVINIVTKKGDGPLAVRTSVMGGSFTTSQEAASVAGGNETVYYSFGGSYFHTEGFSAADRRLPGNFERDGFRLGTFSGRTGWTPAENCDVDFVIRYNRGTVHIDDGGGPFMDDPNQTNFTEQTFFRTQLRYENYDGWWEQKLAFNVADHRRRNDDPEDVLHPGDSFFSNFNGQTRQLDWQHNFRLHETNTLTVGVVDQEEEGDSAFRGTFSGFAFDGRFDKQRLRDTAVYVDDQIRIADRWFTTLGARQDNYSLAGVADTYRATTLVRLPGSETGLRATIGTGFKAPTIFQLFDGFSGNPELRPEQSKGWDYGLEQPLADGRVVLAVTYFRNDFDNLIDFDPVTFRFFNVNRALATGVELAAAWFVDDAMTVTASYTRTDTRDLETGLPLLRRPKHKAGLAINRRVLAGRGNVNVGLVYVGDRDDVFGFPLSRVLLDEYVVVNAALTCDVTSWCQAFVRVDNLFDARYQEVFGFGTPRLSAYGGVSVLW